MAATGPHLSFIAEPIFSLGGFEVTNSVFTSVIISVILIGFATVVRANIKDTDRPTGIQNFAEWIVESLYNFVHSITNNHKKTKQFLPIIGTFFLFILLNNWFGLLPGVGSIVVNTEHEASEEHAATEEKTILATDVYAAETTETDEHTLPILEHDDAEALKETHGGEDAHSVVQVPIFRPGTADLNTTIALGIVSIFLTQVIGFQYLQFSYFSKFLNFSSPIMFFVGIVEIISEFAKIISFAFRLFGNIFAGEVLLVILTHLTSLVAPMPFYGLEIFVGFIQALVFSMISLVFFNMATEGHEH